MFNKIVEKTLENGGYTNSVNGRYVVAIKGYEKVVDLEKFNENVVKQYSEEVGQEFGTWINDGKVYLDKVECMNDEQKAMKIAKERNEIALFDLETLTEIFVK